jgi:hypothetical protein
VVDELEDAEDGLLVTTPMAMPPRTPARIPTITRNWTFSKIERRRRTGELSVVWVGRIVGIQMPNQVNAALNFCNGRTLSEIQGSCRIGVSD